MALPLPAALAKQSRTILERITTQWNTVTVVGRGRTRHLEVDGATYATFHPTRRWFGYAWDALTAATLYHPAASQDGGRGYKILLIGLGGGTSLHSMRAVMPHASITTAEIDPVLVDISERHFALSTTGAKVVVGDGYAHVDENPGAYDAIIDDAFLSRGETARTEDVSEAFLARLTKGLAPGGLLASNVFTDLPNMEAEMRSRRLFARAFKSSFAVVPPRGANAILVGSPNPRSAEQVRAHVMTLPRASRAALMRLAGPGLGTVGKD